MRKSKVHYIAPSAISITPNANNSHRDLAVYLARDAKIKVYSPNAGIDTDEDTSSYQEWTLTGRNRRLADTTGTVPYTIYAKLSTVNKSAYLVFAAMTPQEDGEYMDAWTEAYSHLTTDGFYVYGKGTDWEEQRFKPNCMFVRLGDVSAAVNGQRTVTLDTGILGTDQYNEEWDDLNPDDLPLRVELGCVIDDEDVGQTPYVKWDKSVFLTANLVEGWQANADMRVAFWTIERNTGDQASDTLWNYPESGSSSSGGSGVMLRRMNGGQITLQHLRGDDDDFGASVAAVFTVMAWGEGERTFGGADSSSSSSGSESSSSDMNDSSSVPLASAVITMLAETLEKIDLVLSSSIVSYNPMTNSYSPSEGVAVQLRSTRQSGIASMLTNGEVGLMRLAVQFTVVGSDGWTDLAFSGAPSGVATSTIPVSAFLYQRSINVRVVRTPESDNSSSSSSSSFGENTGVDELAMQTIAFVRDGEDSKEREWIFKRTETEDYGTAPADISGGQVNPVNVATGNDHDRNQDGWVPEGWSDEMRGADSTYRFEYGAYRDFIYTSEGSDDSDSSSSSSSSNGASTAGGHWGGFSTPRIWHRYSENGENSVRIDLDNQADIISLDGDGKVRFARTIVIHARIYDGGRPAATGVTKDASLTAAYLTIGGCEPTVSDVVDGVVTITWVFTVGMTAAATARTIALTYNGATYSAVFNLGSTNASTLWQIMPNPSEVSFKLDTSANALTPATQILKCGYTRQAGSGTASIAEATTVNGQIQHNNANSGMYLYYRIRSDNAWGSWTAYPTAGITIASSTTVQDYEFCITTGAMANNESNIEDRQCVVVVKDGANGLNMRENIIDNSEPKHTVNVTSATADRYGQRYFYLDKTYDPEKIPADSTKISGQARITLTGCTFTEGKNPSVFIYITNRSSWPGFVNFNVSEDGVYDKKVEGITINSNGGGSWNGNVLLRLLGFEGGTVSVERVKLEIGEKCTAWCLSENDKKAYNTRIVTLYKQQTVSTSAPTIGPGRTLYYKFSTQKLYTDAGCTTEFDDETPNGNGWGPVLPSAQAGKKIYITSATAYARGDSDAIAASEWATPVLFSEDMLKETVRIYKRLATEPAETPVESRDVPADGAVFTFADGALTGTLNGWSTNVPTSDGNPCYMRHATAMADVSSTSDVINRSEWSEAVKYVEDGEDALSTSPNLLDGTGFILNFNKWTITNSNASLIDGGVNGQKAFRYSGNDSNRDVLRQSNIWKTDGSGRLRGGTWYTLSYYIRGNMARWGGTLYPVGVSGNGYLAYDQNEKIIVDGEEQAIDSNGIDRSFDCTPNWIRHTVSFKTASSLPSSYSSLTFKLYCSGIAATVDRDGRFTLSQWDVFGEIGYSTTWSGAATGGVTVGSIIAIAGKTTDTLEQKVITARVTEISDSDAKATTILYELIYRDVCCIKLEEGQKATPWCLSESDKIGASTPWYNEEYFGWSASSSGTTDPGDVAWSEGTPARVTGKPYLWRKARLMVYDEDAASYEPASSGYVYACLTGSDGTSIAIKGEAIGIATGSQQPSDVSASPFEGDVVLNNSSYHGSYHYFQYDNGAWIDKTASYGDSYLIPAGNDKGLWQLNAEAGKWIGPIDISGPAGQSSYVHIIWSKKDPTDNAYTFDAGDYRTAMTASSNTDYLWMGVKADQNPNDSIPADITEARTYTWSYVKGPQGESSPDVVVRCTPGSLTVPCTSGGTVKAQTSAKITFDMSINGATATISNINKIQGSVYIAVYDNTASGYTDLTSKQRTVVVPTALPASDINQGLTFEVTGVVGGGYLYTRYVTFPLIAAEDGDDAAPTPYYSIVPTPASVNFRSNAVGDFQPSSVNVSVQVRKVTPSGSSNLTPAANVIDGKYYLYYFDQDAGVWYRATNDNDYAIYNVTASDALDSIITSVPYVLSTSSTADNTANGITAANTVARFDVPVICDGRQGVQGESITGAPGKMFYSMGRYDPSVIYAIDDLNLLIPLVFYCPDNPTSSDWNDALGIYGNYYYLKKSMTSAGQGGAPKGNTEYWKVASGFGLVITQGVFAEFAKLGKGIFSGDYFFSMNGMLDGTVKNAGATWKGVPAYTLFAGDTAEKAFSYEQTSFALTTSYQDITGTGNDTGIPLGAGETMVLKLKFTIRTNETHIRVYDAYGNTVAFQYSTNASTSSWTSVAAGSQLTVSNNTVYYIRISSSTTMGYTLRANTTSAYNAAFTLKRMIFEPNWWVDLLTGKMSAARGNFVVDGNGEVFVNGTVKARNLFHNVCIYIEGGTYRDARGTRWFYCSTSSYTSLGIRQYGYYSEAEITSAGLTDNSGGLTLCTYDADIISMNPNGSSNWSSVNEDKTVILPRPDDFEGKMVEVTSFNYGISEKTAYVGCVKNNAFAYKLSSGSSGLVNDTAASVPSVTVTTGTQLRFVSVSTTTGYFWLRI